MPPYLLFQAQPDVITEKGLDYAWYIARKYENEHYSVESELDAHELLLALVIRDDIIGLSNRQLKAIEKAKLVTVADFTKMIDRLKKKYRSRTGLLKKWVLMDNPRFSEITLRKRLPDLYAVINQLVD
jgi:hypothetical protein